MPATSRRQMVRRGGRCGRAGAGGMSGLKNNIHGFVLARVSIIPMRRRSSPDASWKCKWLNPVYVRLIRQMEDHMFTSPANPFPNGVSASGRCVR